MNTNDNHHANPEKYDHEVIIGSIDVDLAFDPFTSLDSSIGADRCLYAITNIGKEIERETLFKAQAIAFYDNRVAQKQKAIAFLESKLESYLTSLEAQGLPAKASTPNGSAFFTTRVSHIWPENQDLVDFARKHKIPDAIKVTETADKKVLKAWIAKNGSKGLDRTEVTNTSLSIRKPTAPKKPVTESLASIGAEELSF